MRQEDSQRDEIEHLACETEEDSFSGAADGGKQVSGNHLEADDQHCGADDTHRADCEVNQHAALVAAVLVFRRSLWWLIAVAVCLASFCALAVNC